MSGLRILGYADLDIAFAFIRDCQAEGNEGVSPETYGIVSAAGIHRPQLSIQEREPAYLSEDEIIAAIDFNSTLAVADDAADEDDDGDETASIEEIEFSDDPDGEETISVAVSGFETVADESDFAAVADPGVAGSQNLPARIGNRRGIESDTGIWLSDRHNRRGRWPHNASWKNRAAAKQYLRHLRRLICR